jgi:hypothetical protein
LAESSRDYDAIIGAEFLLSILRQFGFHVLLHGHKHSPFTFVEDIKNGFENGEEDKRRDHALIIVSGGSAGSEQLPPSHNSTNCYNRILIKWDPDAETLRVKVITRSLVRHRDTESLLPSEWFWETRREDDRWFTARRRMPILHEKYWKLRPFGPTDKKAESLRKSEYERTRGNMAVAEVRPSLTAHQRYEVQFWIVPHESGSWERKPEDIPLEVTWSAGPKFPVKTIQREHDKMFCACFEYWGPMLIQGRLKFSDGSEEYAYVYARMPGAGR